MTEAQYAALTAACDALLTAPDAPLERIAVSWLHVRSEHPEYLKPYCRVFAPRNPISDAKRVLARWVAMLATLSRSIADHDATRESPADVPGRIDCLILSHVVSEDPDPSGADFYFGRLQDDLAARGYTSLAALRNHVGSYRNVAARWYRGGAAARMVLPRRDRFSRELAMLRGVARAAGQLRRLARRQCDEVARAVAFEAAIHAASPVTLTHLRTYGFIEALCRRLRPRAVLVTWEGHAWERVAFRAARHVDPNVRCIGYQHTIMLPRSHALKRPLGGPYDPDAIFTVGDVTRDIISSARGMDRIPVVTYGSYRKPAAPLPRATDSGTRCLVIPEGLESECLILFGFALVAAERMPGLEFILRTHPLLSYDTLAARQASMRNLPPNVRVSDEPAMAADFARCDWALYRGSSVAVYAVLAGVRPLYLERQGELPIDPLFALDRWKRRIGSMEDFQAVIAADRGAAAVERQVEWARASAFCERYVVHADVKLVEDAIRGKT
jgi:hypothetical protein